MALPSTHTRINHNGYLGTVRYVGEVDSTNGIWLGIEWDDPKRGKHDGVKDGKRYFTCRIPNAGSFIRPSASISYGVTFLEALMSKYIEAPHGTASQEKVILGSSQGAIEVEAVRLDKIRGKYADLPRVRQVSLDGEKVAKCDPPGKIRATCPNVRGLDLSRSLLCDWTTVAAITAELPLLQILAVNQNRFRPLDDLDTRSAFMNLTELQLNGTLLTWDEMTLITNMMPRLVLVEMGYNCLETLNSSHIHAGTPIGLINLDSNHCADWAHVCSALKPYEALQRLIVTSNSIAVIPPPDNHLGVLENLKHLSLSFNRLNSWSDIDALHMWCPSLETLSLTGNPLVNEHDLSRYTRQFTISKLPSLLILDGAAVSKKERLDCELFYLSYIAQHGPPTEEGRLEAHPQWRTLCERHGAPEEAPKRQDQHNKLSNHLFDVHIYQLPEALTDARAGPAMMPSVMPSPSPMQALRVLPTMPLRTFRLKLCKLAKVPPGRTTVMLWLKTGDGEYSELGQEQDNHDLAWLGIESGSEISFFPCPK